jgi:hypothetical protein
MIKDIAGEVFYMVEPSVQNVNKTYDSFSNPEFGNFRNVFFQHGLTFLDNEYKSVFDDCVATSEEVAERVDWSKSAGYTATYHGIQTKKELQTDPGYIASEYNTKPENVIPMTTIANKKELKHIDEIKDNKIRCFFISEYVLFKSQLEFGLRPSLKLKGYKWSGYGFSPFRGGVNKLANRLLSKPIRWFYDVSGWDKFIPIMRDLYSWIFHVSKIPKELMNRFIWMIQHTIAFICVTYDGDVIRKWFGNASGSGTTTRDNILMHIILTASYLSEAYYLKFGKLPSIELLAEQVVSVFGDDGVFSCDKDFDMILDGIGTEDGFLFNFFKRFGMKLKFLYGGEDYPIEKMEFLGFRFKLINGIYFPYWDPIRTATSFIYTNDKKDDLGAYISKCFVLTMMAYPTEYKDIFLNAYKQLILSVTDDELTPVIKSFRDIGPLTPEILEMFFTGSESTFIDFCFFESVLEAVGRKLDFFDVSDYNSNNNNQAQEKGRKGENCEANTKTDNQSEASPSKGKGCRQEEQPASCSTDKPLCWQLSEDFMRSLGLFERSMSSSGFVSSTIQ